MRRTQRRTGEQENVGSTGSTGDRFATTNHCRRVEEKHRRQELASLSDPQQVACGAFLGPFFAELVRARFSHDNERGKRERRLTPLLAPLLCSSYSARTCCRQLGRSRSRIGTLARRLCTSQSRSPSFSRPTEVMISATMVRVLGR